MKKTAASQLIMPVLVVLAIFAVVRAWADASSRSDASSGRSVFSAGPTEAEIKVALDRAAARNEADVDLFFSRLDSLGAGKILNHNTAAFHVVQPNAPRGSGDESGMPLGGGNIFNDCMRNYYYPVVDRHSRLASYTTANSVSWNSAFKNSMITSAAIAPDANDLNHYEVVVLFSQSAISFFAALLKTTPGIVTSQGRSVDWAGYARPDGWELTRMDVALVSNGQCYRPWSISDYVAANDASKPIVVATELNQQEASALMNFLGF